MMIQIVQKMAPGGLEILALELLDGMKRDGEDSLIIALEGDQETSQAEWPRLQYYQGDILFLNKPPGLHLPTILTLRRILKNRGAGAVLCHHAGPMLYGGLAARLAGIPGIIQVEHDAWHLDDPARTRLYKLGLHISKAQLVGVSEMVAAAVTARLGISDVAVVPNGVDQARFKPSDEARVFLANRDFTIGFCGRLEPVKNLDLLFTALAAGGLAGCKLRIAGAGSMMATWQAAAAEKGLADRVSFLGNVDDTVAFYRSVDLLVLPSHNEGLPLTLLEAQSCGVPVIATDVGGVAQAVHPDSGHLVPAGDAQALAAAIRIHCSRSPAAQRHHRRQAREWVGKNWSIAATLRGYKNLVTSAGNPAGTGFPPLYVHQGETL